MSEEEFQREQAKKELAAVAETEKQVQELVSLERKINALSDLYNQKLASVKASLSLLKPKRQLSALSSLGTAKSPSRKNEGKRTIPDYFAQS